MAKRRNKKKQDETLVDIVDAKEQAQDFIDKNQTYIFGALTAAVLLIGAFFAYKYMYQAPKEKEALEGISQAQFQFSQDSFALALTNPGDGYEGFLDLIDSKGGTQSGHLANLYAGISHLHLGQYEAAIDYLQDYSPSGNLMPIVKNGVMGDAYSELNEFDQALSYYQKAVNAGDNEMLTPYYLLKLGMLNLKQQNFAASKDAFQKIKDDYPLSQINRDAEKYLSRVEAKL